MDLTNAEGSARTTLVPRSCTACGQADERGRFCGLCGSPLEEEEPGTSPQPSPQIPEQYTVEPHGEGTTLFDDMLLAPHPAPTSTSAPDLAAMPRQGSEDEDASIRSVRLTRRRAVAASVAVAVSAGLIAGGVVGAGYLANGDVRTALTASSRDFNSVVDRLSEATTAEQVSLAAGEAAATADRIEAAERRLKTEKDPARVSVGNQLESEQTVLLAVAGLEGLARDPLTTWGAAHSELTAALAVEDDTRAVLRRFDDDAARGLSDTSRMLAKVTSAVGPALVEDATEESTRLLTSLTSAKTTADLRKLGDAAAPEHAAVAAAGKALPDGDGKQVLTGYAAGLSSLAKLSTISGESPGTWSATRADLARTFGQVAAAAGSTGGANVRVVLDGALGSADKVVLAASAATVDWKAKTDAAIKARSADTEALADYASFFRSQAKTYEQLRGDLTGFLQRVEDPDADVSYYEAYEFLSEAAQNRKYVRDALVSTDVPNGVEPAHADVTAAIDRAITAVQSAYDGFEQSQDCWDGCPYYRETPGYKSFLSKSEGVRKSYSAAMAQWEAEVATAKAAIADRPLPDKPQV